MQAYLGRNSLTQSPLHLNFCTTLLLFSPTQVVFISYHSETWTIHFYSSIRSPLELLSYSTFAKFVNSLTSSARKQENCPSQSSDHSHPFPPGPYTKLPAAPYILTGTFAPPQTTSCSNVLVSYPTDKNLNKSILSPSVLPGLWSVPSLLVT